MVKILKSVKLKRQIVEIVRNKKGDRSLPFLFMFKIKYYLNSLRSNVLTPSTVILP